MALVLAGHIHREGQRRLMASWAPGVPLAAWAEGLADEAAVAFDGVLRWAVACRIQQPFDGPAPSPALVAATLVADAQTRLGDEHAPDLAHALARLEAAHGRGVRDAFPSHLPGPASSMFRRAEALLTALGGVVDVLDGHVPAVAGVGKPAG